MIWWERRFRILTNRIVDTLLLYLDVPESIEDNAVLKRIPCWIRSDTGRADDVRESHGHDRGIRDSRSK